MKRTHQKPVKALVLIAIAIATLYGISVKSGTGAGTLSPLSNTQMAEVARIKNELQAAQIQLNQATDKKEIRKLQAKIFNLQRQLAGYSQPITPRPVFRS